VFGQTETFWSIALPLVGEAVIFLPVWAFDKGIAISFVASPIRGDAAGEDEFGAIR